MKLSARNQLSGQIVAIDRGPVTAVVRVDIGGGRLITSSITAGASEELGLAVGDAVTVIVKSTDVIIGK